jgi:hypothetical protein
MAGEAAATAAVSRAMNQHQPHGREPPAAAVAAAAYEPKSPPRHLYRPVSAQQQRKGQLRPQSASATMRWGRRLTRKPFQPGVEPPTFRYWEFLLATGLPRSSSHLLG